MSISSGSRLLLLPGEPAGIGPDLVVMMAQRAWPVDWMVLADPVLLRRRAQCLNLPLHLVETDPAAAPPISFAPGTLPVWPLPLPVPEACGVPDEANAPVVLEALRLGSQACLRGEFGGLVTGPLHKASLCRVSPGFSGHTEYLARLCGVEQSVMLFVGARCRLALATTHLPLRQVPEMITKDRLRSVLQVLCDDLKRFFQVPDPLIRVLGLNPHAGEDGYLGSEETQVIAPLLSELREEGMRLDGPVPADSAFIGRAAGPEADAILSMYHDQALPVIKALDFGSLVNMTLGLPFVRTSVDHGTAFDLAGTGRIDSGGMRAALTLAAHVTAGLCPEHA